MMFEVVLGYNDAAQFKQKAQSFLDACDRDNIFLKAKITAPAFDLSQSVLSHIPDQDIASLDESGIFRIIDAIFRILPEETKEKLAKAVSKAFLPFPDKTINPTQLKNAFIRTISSLHKEFAGLLSRLDQGAATLFFEGDLNKYDFLTLNVLYFLGVNSMVICLKDKSEAFISLADPHLRIIDGTYKTRLDFQPAQKTEPDTGFSRNLWLDFSQCSDIDSHIDLLLQNIPHKNAPQNAENVVALNFLGAVEKQKYETAVNRFYLSLKSKCRLYIIDSTFANPTFDEVQAFNDKKGAWQTTEDILNTYLPLQGTPYPYHVKQTLDSVLAETQFQNEAQKKNFVRVLQHWLIRLCDFFFQDKTSLDPLPVLIIWGKIPKRIENFLRCLVNMPIHIIQFSPHKETNFSPETQKTIVLGPGNPDITSFPYELQKLAEHETVAYRAEQEIREVLSNGLTSYYQMKQFKEINPIILKTTFEEIDIMWREPAKFRPGFSTVGDIVTIPSIFAKINGVKDTAERYIAEIQAKITPETVLFDKNPYIPPCTDTSALSFMRQVYFKNFIDTEKIQKSPYYQYALFGIETQNVILKGIADFFQNDWYVQKRSSFTYKALELLLRLPHNVIQLVHDFNTTETIPKVIVFNPTDIPCSEEDCVCILFLKSIGFDVIIYVPTGYRVIEDHISETLFHTINIGPYNYDLSQMEIIRKKPQKKKGFLSKLFK